MIHDRNCTRCRHRKVYPKAIDKKYEMEICGMRHRRIPSPREGGRYCELFQQEGCDCESCNILVPGGTNT